MGHVDLRPGPHLRRDLARTQRCDRRQRCQSHQRLLPLSHWRWFRVRQAFFVSCQGNIALYYIYTCSVSLSIPNLRTIPKRIFKHWRPTHQQCCLQCRRYVCCINTKLHDGMFTNLSQSVALDFSLKGLHWSSNPTPHRTACKNFLQNLLDPCLSNMYWHTSRDEELLTSRSIPFIENSPSC